LFGRGAPGRAELAGRRLEETRSQLAAATGAGLGSARAAQARRWADRLEDLLEEDPGARAELRALVGQVQAQLVSAAGHSAAAARDLNLAEISSPDYPGERLVACKNPFLEAERARKRESLLTATETDLAKIAAAVQRPRRPLRGTGKIALRADRVLRRRKVAKHFRTEITDDRFSYARNTGSITAEAALDGIYVLRTSVEASGLASGEVVSSYKALAQVERAFRAFNTDLDIRPIRHRTETRVGVHVFLRMLSYYITWHMQARLAPILFTDDDKPAAQAARTSPVAPAAPAAG
jgi:hypothetical protein